MLMGKYVLGKSRRKKRRWPFAFIPLASIVFLNYIYLGTAVKDPPAATATAAPTAKTIAANPESQPKIIKQLPWPSYGQAAYGATDDGVLAQSNSDSQAVPIASLAKVITALVVLDKKPIALGEQGPTITLTDKDVALYQDYLAKDGTVVPVQAGEQISQYQAMQAMILPSSNNMADSLAIWAFGSVEKYNAYANDLLKKKGLIKTTVADASGYSPMTMSTADEMVKIGILYLQNPVLREIASQTEATIPYAGRIKSYHASVNDGTVIGLKIGYTEEAGRTFLAADITNETKGGVSVAAVLGAGSMQILLRDVKALLLSGANEHDQLDGRPASQ